jgi:glyoxylase I family protein
MLGAFEGAIMSNLKFSHLCLSSPDPVALERFYCTHFGFSRARVIPLGEQQVVFLKSGAAYLELFQSEGDRPTPAVLGDGPHTTGLRHLAFQVDSVDEALVRMGDDAHITAGPMDFDAFIPGWRTVWLSDPDGNIVEISQGYTDQDAPPLAA